MCSDAVEGGLTLVMKTIQAAALSEAEQQTLVDTLLSKPGHQWTKVGTERGGTADTGRHAAQQARPSVDQGRH